MRPFTTYLCLAAGFITAAFLFAPLAPANASAGEVQVTITDEARAPIVNATVEVTCDASTYATLGVTSATGTIIGDPTVGTTCVNGSAPLFRVSSSTFATQLYPIIGYSLLPYYSSVDPSTSSTAISGSTNVYKFGLDTVGSYAIKVWNAHGDASVLPFPTGVPDYTTTSSHLAYNWGVDTSPFPGIDADDWFVEATKTVTLDSGWYEFEIASDDGNIVTLDGTTVISNYILQPIPARPYIKRLMVTAGVHTIDIKYYEHTGYTGLYFRFYPIDAPTAPLIEIGDPISSPVNHRLSPSFGLHSDTRGTLSVSGGCTTTDAVEIGVGTSTISLTALPNGTYSSCTVSLLDPDTDYSTELAIPTFTVGDPPLINISDCADLEAIDATSTYYAADFILDSDIDCTGVTPHSLSWSGHAFIGIFDGNDHTISNFNLDDFETYMGLFQSINGATIQNLSVSNSSVQGFRYAGVLAGTATNPTMTNVHIQNAPMTSLIFFPDNHFGGLFGAASFTNGETIEWSNITVDSQIIPFYRTGGGLAANLTLSSSSTLILDNVHVSSSIVGVFGSSLESAGGLFGQVAMNGTSTLSIIHSNSNSQIDVGAGGTSGSSYIGLLDINSAGPINFSISYSSSSRNITGSTELGALIGSFNHSDGDYPYTLNLHHDQSSAAISGGNNVGGLIGSLYNSFDSAVTSTITIDSTTSTGAVVGDGNVGGLIGGTSEDGGSAYIHHAQGAGGLTLTNNIVTGNVTGNSHDEGSSNAGGLVGFLSCRSNNPTQFASCTLRQNSVSGNVVGNANVGGLAGRLDGDIDVEDSYSTGNVTGASNLGGFIGNLTSNFHYTNVSRVYSSSTVTTSGASPTNIGGFIGHAQSSHNSTNIDHAFAIASLSDPSGRARIGWVAGSLENVTPSNIAYSPISGLGTACIQNNERATYCTAQNDPNYFYSASNSPQSSWDFTQIWQAHDATYPTLRLAAVAQDTTAPVISNIVTTPSNVDALIAWNTDEPASSQIIYGTGSLIGAPLLGPSDQSPRVLTHRILLPNLATCQTYNLQVSSADTYGNSATSSAFSFTTGGCGGSAARGSVGGGGSGGSGGSFWGSPIPVQALTQPATTSPALIVALPSELIVAPNSSSPTPSAGTGSSANSRKCARYTFSKDLKTGTVAQDVRELQLFLQVGTASSTTTFFGPATKQALAEFQRAHQLPTNGNFSGATRTLIQSLMPTAPCPAAQTFNRTLKQSMTGSDVKALQHLLKISETSFFGPATKKALQTFQQSRGLPPNGTTDAATRGILNSLVK